MALAAARCGSSIEHGAHTYFVPNGRKFGAYMSDLRAWCAGNRNIVTAVVCDDCGRWEQAELDGPCQHYRPSPVSPFTRRALAAQLPGKVVA